LEKHVSVTKDQNSRKRDQLQPVGPPHTGSLLAGPVASDFVRIDAGDAKPPGPVSSSDVPFVFRVAIDEITLSHLTTSGFEGFELPDPRHTDSIAEPPVPAETPRTVFVPVLTSIPPATKPVFDAEYEPMEFLDFDEPVTNEVVVEAEPEIEPPPIAVDFLAVPVRFVNLSSAAKPVQGVGDIPMPALPVHPPELKLGTLRRRIVSGPNPAKSAPKHESVIAPAPAAPAPAAAKPGQPVVVRSAPAAKQPPVRTTKPAAEPKPLEPSQPKPNIAVRPAASTPAESPARPAPPSSKPAIAARDRGSNALAVSQPEAEPAAAPVPKPKLMPIRKVEAVPVPNASEAAATEAMPFQGISSTLQSAGMSPALKGSIAATVVVVLGLAGYFGFAGKDSKTSSSGETQGFSDVTSPGMVMGGGGWTTTWGVGSPVNQNKQISIYRPSMALTDYRFEFRGRIDKKALGWIFRASNPKNYYVMKLEMIKPGASPIVALMKYAVIDGKETTRTQVMLPFTVSLDTVYSVRLDVKGDKFATYVQDKLVDHWIDDRIKTGGTGFYSDKNERAQIKSSQVSYLTAAR
jgi:hypothetical protein